MTPDSLQLDAVIFGGGVAGLWLLDELHRRGFSAWLIERTALGSGQTIASQGILHGGLKYALTGNRSASTDAIREMPGLWQACLAGSRQPDLTPTRILSPCCYLWRTDSLTSRLGMVGARIGLSTPVDRVAAADRPAALAHCPGEVYRVDEPVIDVSSLLATLAARHETRIWLVGDSYQLAIEAEGRMPRIRISRTPRGESLLLEPKSVILAAGEGNADLRRACGLPGEIMQRRPLHQVLVRGELPELFGHCVDGAKTRVTITSASLPDGRRIWNVGGDLAERGATMEPADLIAQAHSELKSVLPGVDWSNTEWSTLRVNRAEGRSPDGRRPEGPVVRREGPFISAWPTKLVLAPQLAKLIVEQLGEPSGTHPTAIPSDWSRPQVAKLPWEKERQWHA